ncbi:MAG: M13 family metallopeptidase [Alphaproteobacteria bacterium]|nr:M13 family metallopeptidase [Alphaproteobacteria bacterium]
MRKSLSVLVILAAAAGIAQADSPQPKFGTWGVDLSSMDKSVKPGDDFFEYVNGAWLKKAEIPRDRTSTGSFQDLQILSENRMKEIVHDLEAKKLKDLSPEEKQLRDLYDAFVDTDAIEKAGLKPAQADLKRFQSVKTLDDVATAMGEIEHNSDSIFADRINADPKNPNAYVVILTQSGLGLPERDYYLKDDPNLEITRGAYVQYMGKMLWLLDHGQDDPRARKVFELEKALAQVEWPAADRRDANKTYNPMTVSELEKFAPGFNWRAYFKAQGVAVTGPAGERKFVVRENTAFPEMAKIFAATPVEVWRDWLTLHYLHNMSAFLPEQFDQTDFEMYGRVLGGADVKLPRDTRGVKLIDGRLGHPLGKLYVARFFPPESKAKVEALVGNLLKAYDADIRVIPWMTETTKKRALDKLHAFVPHIGYPDKWRDYSGLAIKRGDLIGDIHRSDVFEWNYRLSRIDRPVDRSEWSMTPPTINAYYTPVFNSIFFPAAILQPPFFDPQADDAVNYGGIGAVIGHEIGHGFDDQGSKYDGLGILQSWWTDEDRKAFDERTAMLGAQFDSYEGLPGLHVNGKLTMGENVGDLSGINIALQAYHISLGGQPAPALDGFTGDQRFFLSFGQIWRSKYRESQMRQQVLSNPHSPPEFRVIGATRNTDAWYTAFDVKPGDKYYLPPEKRVHLW